MEPLAEEVKKELQNLADTEYQKFHSGLLPGVEHILGVRVPELRKIAKKLSRGEWRSYLEAGCDDTYEEIMIQGMLIGYAKMEKEERVKWLDLFVPKINNWAVCDCCTSTYKFMQKNQDEWFSYLMKQIDVGSEYSIRFGVVALMDYFVTEEWIDTVLKIYDGIFHEGYYVKMAVAWAVSMCYVKFPGKTRAFLEDNHLDTFTQNKAIQKIRESYRVSKEEKEELKQLKR